MDINTIKKTRRNIILILFLSIICLLLISFLPWIAVAENGSVKENLHFNFEMMEDSDNLQINGLLNILMDIYILFWTIVIISLISFIFIVYYALIKRTLLFRMLILASSSIIFVLCAFVVYFQIIFSRTIDEIDSISASMMIPPFAYAYVQFIISIFLLIFSGFYTINIINDTTKHFKSYKIQKKEKKKELEQKTTKGISIESEIEKSLKIPSKTDSLKNSSREEKLAEIDKLLAKKDSDKDKQKEDVDISKKESDKQVKDNLPSENEKIVYEEKETEEEPIEDVEPEIKDNKQIKHPFPEKKPKKEIEKSDEIKLSEHFEKVLSTAIEKKQSEIKPKQQKEEKIIKNEKVEPSQIEKKQELIKPDFENDSYQKDIKENLTDKILKIKCPECNYIFPYNKESGKKIICPKCGKEGKIEIKI